MMREVFIKWHNAIINRIALFVFAATSINAANVQVTHRYLRQRHSMRQMCSEVIVAGTDCHVIWKPLHAIDDLWLQSRWFHNQRCKTNYVFYCCSQTIYYTSASHLLLSDSWLEHWLLRYSQNRGGGGGVSVILLSFYLGLRRAIDILPWPKRPG